MNFISDFFFLEQRRTIEGIHIRKRIVDGSIWIRNVFCGRDERKCWAQIKCTLSAANYYNSACLRTHPKLIEKQRKKNIMHMRLQHCINDLKKSSFFSVFVSFFLSFFVCSPSISFCRYFFQFIFVVNCMLARTRERERSSIHVLLFFHTLLQQCCNNSHFWKPNEIFCSFGITNCDLRGWFLFFAFQSRLHCKIRKNERWWWWWSYIPWVRKYNMLSITNVLFLFSSICWFCFIFVVVNGLWPPSSLL